MPCAIAAVPPALVERLPPMVQVPSEGRSCGSSRSTAAAASRAHCKVTPASQVIRVGGRIDLADAVEPVEGEHDFVVVRDLAADQPGIAALRHDRSFGRVGELKDRGHFGDQAGPQHHRGVGREQMGGSTR